MNKGLTSFRAFAFLAVYLYHVRLLSAGYLGVQAFFVLSGFLLTPILCGMKESLDTRHYFTHFYGRRSLRIFPLYYVYIALVTLLAVWFWARAGFAEVPAITGFFNELPWALTYTYNFFFEAFPNQTSPVLSHFWSLAVEEQFYLVWPLLLLLTPKPRLGQVLLALVLLGPLVRLAMTFVWGAQNIPGIGAPVQLGVYMLPFAHLDAFAIGGYFALFRPSQSARATWALIAGAIGLGFAAELVTSGRIGDWTSLGYAPLMLGAHKPIWGYSVLNLTFAAILVAVRDGRFLPRVFENRALLYLGRISYGLYVFHFIVVGYFAVKYPLLHPALQWTLPLVVTVLLSALSFELMEKRFIGLKDRWFTTNVAPASLQARSLEPSASNDPRDQT